MKAVKGVRLIHLMVLILMVAVFFTGCVQPTGPGTTLDEAKSMLEEGDMDQAAGEFEKVLKEDPDNPEANAGLAITEMYSAFRGLLSTAETAKDVLDVGSEMIVLGWRGAGISRVLEAVEGTGGIGDLQTGVVDDVRKLEKAKSLLEKALGKDVELKIKLNKVDWDGDGIKEPEKPLKLIFNDGSEHTAWELIFCDVDVSATPIGISADSGDAWFDVETLQYLKNENRVPDGYEPTFDENDYILITSAELYALYILLNLQLAPLEALLIYHLDPGDAFKSWMENPDIVTLDTDANGTVTQQELKAIMDPDFLKFRPVEEEGGADAISDLKGAVIGIRTGLEGLEGELVKGADDPHTPMYYFAGEALLEDVREGRKFFEYLEAQITDESTFVDLGIDLDQNGETEKLRLSVFFKYPDRFEDLKEFLPDIGYTTGLKLLFPDGTFGGLIEGFGGILILQ